MKNNRKLALASVLSALSIIFLLVGSIVSVLDLTFSVITSVIIVFAVIELRGSYPWLIYFVTSMLSLLLLPDKFAAVVYLLFAGVYPILKEQFERLHYVISWILKLSTFNTGLLLIIVAVNYILAIPDSGIGFTVIVFLLGNITFLLYDIVLSRLILLYLVKLRKVLGIDKFFKY